MQGFLKFLFYIVLAVVLLSFIGGIYRFFKPDVSSGDANIGVIEIDGVIIDSLPVLEQLAELKKHDNLKGLIVRLNSPGGAVGASQEIYMELKKLKGKIPVAISMADVAASGGLYVSLGGERVFTLPGTLTGSMGVLLQITNFSRLLDKIYIDPITIKSGELKDAGNPSRPLDPQAKRYFQELITKTFEGFKQAVQEERKLSNEAVEKLKDGRVVTGTEAVKMGLADEIGTFNDAAQWVKQTAKISDDIEFRYLSRKPRGWLERALDSSLQPIHQWAKERALPLLLKWEAQP